MLFGLQDVTVSQGGVEILSHIDFKIQGTEKIALVGKNGAGKSTLLSVLSGELPVDRDDKRKNPAVTTSRSLTIGTLHQTVFADASQTALEYFQEAFLKSSGTTSVWKDGFQKNLETGDGIQADDRDKFLFECQCDRMLCGFGFDKEDKYRAVGEFSGGQQTKLGLIAELLCKPDVLLLDEPTNHLDIQSVEWLEECLKAYPGAVVVVSHDRFFIDRVAEIVYEVDNGKVTRYVGNYTDYRKQKEQEYRKRSAAWERYNEEKNRLLDTVKRFKGKPTKASMARAKLKQLERIPVPPDPGRPPVHYTKEIVPKAPGPKWVYEAEHLKVGYDRILFTSDMRIRRGQKIAVLGINGCGKTALLKTVAGKISGHGGKNTLGNQVLLGYYDQKSGELGEDITLFEHFHKAFPQMLKTDEYTLLATWGFDGAQAMQSVATMSGGEKSRLIMAELMESCPNFLVLDEPTNHMDIEAKELLEDAFRHYSGTMLFVSHDRYFISQVADALVIIQDGEMYYYPFGYEHYLNRREQSKDDSVPLGSLRAEDAAMVAALKAVPKRERFNLREEPTEKAYRDWKLRLLDEELMRNIVAHEEAMLNMTSISDWDAADEALTEAYLLWYNGFLELEE